MQQSTGVVIETTYSWLAFMLTLTKPKTSVDGAPAAGDPWGTHFIPLAPGQHQVEVSFPWLFIGRAGKGQMIVDVHEGHATHVVYKAPTWGVFLPGKVTVLSVTPTVGAALPPISPAYATLLGMAPQPQASIEQQPMAAAPVAPQTAATQAPTAQAEVSAANPASWHPDPTGRHEQRYFDGSAWTEHVSSAGQQSSDPI